MLSLLSNLNEKDDLKTNASKFMQAINGFGLPMTFKTGGNFKKSIQKATWKKTESGHNECTLPNGDTITFLDGELFLRTIQTTEEMMNIRLFT